MTIREAAAAVFGAALITVRLVDVLICIDRATGITHGQLLRLSTLLDFDDINISSGTGYYASFSIVVLRGMARRLLSEGG